MQTRTDPASLYERRTPGASPGGAGTRRRRDDLELASAQETSRKTPLFDPSIAGDAQQAIDLITNILESSTEYSIIGNDLDGRIVLWNEGARRLYGYEPEEVAEIALPQRRLTQTRTSHESFDGDGAQAMHALNASIRSPQPALRHEHPGKAADAAPVEIRQGTYRHDLDQLV